MPTLGSDEKVQSSLDLYQSWLEKYGTTCFAVFYKNKDGSLEFAGRAGVWSFYNPDNDRLPDDFTLTPCFSDNTFAELGYTLHKKFWGKGYGAQIATAATDLFFKKYPNAQNIAVVHKNGHTASQKIIFKLGGTSYGKVNSGRYGEENFYIINKDEFYKQIKVKYLPYTESGFAINSDFLNGLKTTDAKERTIQHLEKNGYGKRKTSYRLRDWGVSRQRYWGCPIPIVHCEKCGIVAEELENKNRCPKGLIELPEYVDLSGKGGNPLLTATIDGTTLWKNTTCPKCNGQAQRETDTLDTFVESSWYFARYLSPKHVDVAFDKDFANANMPVDQYIGGVEHAVLHLLYARFFTKALRELGYWNVSEPFKNLLTQGMVCHAAYQTENGRWVFPDEVHNDTCTATGEKVLHRGIIKMSKSKKNVVDPAYILQTFGADAARMFALSDTPPDRDFEWQQEGISAVHKYLNRLWKLVVKNKDICVKQYQEINFSLLTKEQQQLHRITHQVIKNYHEEMNRFAFNKIIAQMHHLSNTIENACNVDDAVVQHAIKALIVMIFPIVPHFATECWQLISGESKITNIPIFDEAICQNTTVSVGVQVNGKMRGTIEINVNSNEEEHIRLSLMLPTVIAAIDNKPIIKKIVVKNRIVNFVV
jgi:leucyl-tRNA synthetase